MGNLKAEPTKRVTREIKKENKNKNKKNSYNEKLQPEVTTYSLLKKKLHHPTNSFGGVLYPLISHASEQNLRKVTVFGKIWRSTTR